MDDVLDLVDDFQRNSAQWCMKPFLLGVKVDLPSGFMAHALLYPRFEVKKGHQKNQTGILFFQKNLEQHRNKTNFRLSQM